MKLVIVESPTKSKTISKYLGKDYKVVASYGHICDLAIDGDDGLGVDIKNDFLPHYEIDPRKAGTVKGIKKLAESADEIILATDPDREGEAISWHLARVLDLDISKTKRLEFHEITPYGIKNAIESPRTIDLPLVEAQETRRILDRIIGFKLSKLLNAKIHSKSAGRVQSVVLKLIVDREREIQNFVPEEYWTLHANIVNENKELCKALLTKINGEKVNLHSLEEKDNYVNNLPKEVWVLNKESKETKHYAPSPFTTSSLQQAAFNLFKMSTKKTMKVAQELFEGITLDKGSIGLITYMRTDAARISPLFAHNVKEYVSKNYGDNYYGFAPVKAKNGSNIQDAHEGIRVTHVDYEPDNIKSYLTDDQYKLYSLIWARSIACCMAPRLSNDTTITFTNVNKDEFEAKSQINTFDGYSKVYSKYEKKIEDSVINFDCKEKDVCQIKKIDAKQNFTKAPSRYSEASLVKAMEEKGIGRPSTYASTIDTIKARDYVSVSRGYLTPTEQGFLTTDSLQEYFSDVINVAYTADMEAKLDDIADSKISKSNVLNNFYIKFDEVYKYAFSTMPKEAPKTTGEICPKCGAELVMRKGKFGDFIGCSNYPTCNFIKEKEKEIPANAKKCPKCGGALLVRKGAYGSFLGCSNYPTCNYMESLKKRRFTK